MAISLVPLVLLVATGAQAYELSPGGNLHQIFKLAAKSDDD